MHPSAPPFAVRPPAATDPRRKLSLFDALCITVGTIIGAGIFKLAPDVAANAGSFPMTVLIWIVGGMMAMSGAVCFAELSLVLGGLLAIGAVIAIVVPAGNEES